MRKGREVVQGERGSLAHLLGARALRLGAGALLQLERWSCLVALLIGGVGSWLLGGRARRGTDGAVASKMARVPAAVAAQLTRAGRFKVAEAEALEAPPQQPPRNLELGCRGRRRRGLGKATSLSSSAVDDACPARFGLVQI
jgi:hypothetical protein